MNTERVLAWAQIVLSVVYVVGYFVMLAVFLLGHIKTPIEWKDQLGVLIGVLTAGVMLILQFWFSRQRPQEPKP